MALASTLREICANEILQRTVCFTPTSNHVKEGFLELLKVRVGFSRPSLSFIVLILQGIQSWIIECDSCLSPNSCLDNMDSGEPITKYLVIGEAKKLKDTPYHLDILSCDKQKPQYDKRTEQFVMS